MAVLCLTDEGHDAPHRNMTTFLIEKEAGFGLNPVVPGLTVLGKIEKMGYKGVDTTELVLEDVRIPATRVLGGRTGQGFYQMMDGVEVGRVDVAARGCGVALRAFERRECGRSPPPPPCRTQTRRTWPIPASMSLRWPEPFRRPAITIIWWAASTLVAISASLKATLIGEGTAEIQKMIVGRRLLEDYQITG